MNDQIEFRNFTDNGKDVFADLYFENEFVIGLSEHIDYICHHGYDDELASKFRTAALLYLGKDDPDASNTKIYPTITFHI